MPTEQQHAFSKVLDLVEEAGCIDHVVLIGSWAEFVYREADVLPGFCPNIKTMDVDFLVRNLRRPSPAARLTALAKERGFFVESDRMTGTTKLLDITGLEVEFLIRKMGEGKEPALKTNIGVTAQALWHMDVILKNTINVRCLSHVVTVPIPEAYAIHKMIINSERGKKAEKDAHAVENMLPLLDEEKQIRYSARYLKKRKQGSVRLQKPMALQRVSWKSSKPLVGSRLGRASCLV